MNPKHPPVANMSTDQTTSDEHSVLRDHFLGWQCRVRQYSLRKEEGRPTSGMRPSLTIDDQPVGHISVLIVKQYSDDYTAQFRYMVQKTNDPAERYQSALDMLSSAYYQRAKEFSDELTALFGPNSPTAIRLINNGQAHLAFSEYNQSYLLPCKVRNLPTDSEGFQATYWHNKLFNPNLPGEVLIVGFQPDWASAQALPPTK